MKILVLGGTYFIGRNIVTQLKTKKYNITLLNRGTKKVFPDLVNLKADRKHRQQLVNALKNRLFDVIIDTSGFTRDDLIMVLDSLNCQIKQYIFLSSLAVCKYPPSAFPIQEDFPKRLLSADGEYGHNKWMAEEVLRKRSNKDGFGVSIIRPSYVYGSYDYSRRFAYIFERLDTGYPVYVDGDGKNILQFGYVNDLAEIITKIAGNQDYYGQEVNISGSKLITVNQLIGLIGQILRKSVTINHLNIKIKKSKLDREILSLPNFDYYADLARSQKLGLISKTSLEDGLNQTYHWWSTSM